VLPEDPLILFLTCDHWVLTLHRRTLMKILNLARCGSIVTLALRYVILTPGKRLLPYSWMRWI